MSQALSSPTATSSLRQRLGDFVEVVARFAEWNIQVVHVPLPGQQVGRFDDTTRTLEIRADAPIEDQLWLLRDTWNLIVFGPDGTSAARRQPDLRLVPSPRERID